MFYTVIYILYIFAFLMSASRTLEVWPSIIQNPNSSIMNIAQFYRQLLEVLKIPLVIIHLLGAFIYFLVALRIPMHKAEVLNLLFSLITYGSSFLLALVFIASDLESGKLTIHIKHDWNSLINDEGQRIASFTNKKLEPNLPLLLKLALTSQTIDLFFYLSF